MATTMTEFKVTANEHMRRDMTSGGKWACSCEACTEIRSLVGMEKMFNVRPLVRELEELQDQLERLPDGPERRIVLDRYVALYDTLAEEMAKQPA